MAPHSERIHSPSCQHCRAQGIGSSRSCSASLTPHTPQLVTGPLVFLGRRHTELAEDITEPFPNPHICYTKLPEFQTARPRAERGDAKVQVVIFVYIPPVGQPNNLERRPSTHFFIYNKSTSSNKTYAPIKPTRFAGINFNAFVTLPRHVCATCRYSRMETTWRQ